MRRFARGNIDALDLALVGPNGAKVMLWSDACGTTGFADREFTFDGSAATFQWRALRGRYLSAVEL